MFSLSETETAAIRAAFNDGGDLAAAVELRRLCPGITDMSHARRCARIVASWTPVSAPVPVPLRPKHKEIS